MPLEIYPEMTSKEAKEERQHLRVWVGRVLALVAVLILTAWATGAYAEEIPVHVLDKDGVEIRLMNKPCVDKVSISQINPAFLDRFKAIDSVWPEKDGTRKRYAGCWALLAKGEYGMPEDTFLLVFEDNTNGAVPKSEFSKKTGHYGA